MVLPWGRHRDVRDVAVSSPCFVAGMSLACCRRQGEVSIMEFGRDQGRLQAKNDSRAQLKLYLKLKTSKQDSTFNANR